MRFVGISILVGSIIVAGSIVWATKSIQNCFTNFRENIVEYKEFTDAVCPEELSRNSSSPEAELLFLSISRSSSKNIPIFNVFPVYSQFSPTYP